jgi:phosphohistidine phosphatase SixA
MKNNNFIFLLCALACLSLSSCYTSYYYVVRHAEKAATPADNPALTAAGQQRAIALCDTLRTKNVKRIFVSQYLRTQQTAQPTASFLQINPTQYNASQPVDSLVAKLRAVAGQNVLVVGHSNTVPGIILKLTGSSISPIPENDFDNFFIIKRVRNLNSDVFSFFRVGTYGAPSP